MILLKSTTMSVFTRGDRLKVSNLSMILLRTPTTKKSCHTTMANIMAWRSCTIPACTMITNSKLLSNRRKEKLLLSTRVAQRRTNHRARLLPDPKNRRAGGTLTRRITNIITKMVMTITVAATMVAPTSFSTLKTMSILCTPTRLAFSTTLRTAMTSITIRPISRPTTRQITESSIN